MQKLKEDLMTRKATLKEEINTPSEEITLLEEFVKTTDFNDLFTYDQIDILKFLCAYVLSLNDNYTVKELKSIIKPISSTLIFLTSKDFQTFLPILYDIGKSTKIPELQKFLDKKPEERTGPIYEILQSVNNNPTDVEERYKMDFTAMLLADSDELIAFLSEYEKDPKNWHNALCIISAIKEITEYKRKCSLLPTKKSLTLPIYKDDILRLQLENAFSTKDITWLTSVIPKSLSKRKKERKEKDKERRREIKNIDNLLSQLEHLPEEITDYRTLIRDIKDEGLRVEILTYIYNHNKKYYDSLDKRYQELKSNSILSYQQLQRKYNIGTLDTTFLMNRYSCDDLKNILETLTQLGITEKEQLEIVLSTTTKETVAAIYQLVENKTITKELVQENMEMLDTANNYPERIKKNKKIIDSITGQSTLYRTRDKVLLLDSEILSKNLETLKDYDYLTSLSTTTNYAFLSQNNLSERLDTILELGWEDTLKNNLSLLNYDKKVWMRLRILEELNIPITSLELESILHTDSFYVPDDTIPSYIDLKPLDEIKIKEDKIVLTPRTYIINGVYFSREKVRRARTREDEPLSKLLCRNRLFTKSEREKITAIEKTYKKN